jgi:signal peptidase I
MDETAREAVAPSLGTVAPGAVAPRAAELDPELAARLAALEQERIRQERWRAQVWRERRALLGILAFVLLILPNFRMAQVVGRSMEPQLESGDRIVVWKSWRHFSPLKTGDIIVFRQGNQELVKRVVFVQNREGTAPWPDYVTTARGDIRVRPWFRNAASGIDQRDHYYPGTQQRSVWVMGDNISNSNDSRDFGPIAPESILGKVLTR